MYTAKPPPARQPANTPVGFLQKIHDAGVLGCEDNPSTPEQEILRDSLIVDDHLFRTDTGKLILTRKGYRRIEQIVPSGYRHINPDGGDELDCARARIACSGTNTQVQMVALGDWVVNGVGGVDADDPHHPYLDPHFYTERSADLWQLPLVLEGVQQMLDIYAPGTVTWKDFAALMAKARFGTRNGIYLYMSIRVEDVNDFLDSLRTRNRVRG